MKNSFIILLLASICILSSCKDKSEEGVDLKDPFFPVSSYIKSQVAHVDTSLYSIIELRVIDSTRTDTISHHRSEFRDLAKDFINLPDLSTKENRKLYVEEKSFDQTLNNAILTVVPINPEKVAIQRQEVLIRPDPSGDQVKSIIVNYATTNKDSSVQKRMLWQVDRNFQVTTIKQMAGKPETITQLRVIWNDPDTQ